MESKVCRIKEGGRDREWVVGKKGKNRPRKRKAKGDGMLHWCIPLDRGGKDRKAPQIHERVTPNQTIPPFTGPKGARVRSGGTKPTSNDTDGNNEKDPTTSKDKDGRYMSRPEV